MYGLPSSDTPITDRAGAGNTSKSRNSIQPGQLSQSCGSGIVLKFGMGHLEAGSVASASTRMPSSVRPVGLLVDEGAPYSGIGVV